MPPKKASTPANNKLSGSITSYLKPSNTNINNSDHANSSETKPVPKSKSKYKAKIEIATKAESDDRVVDDVEEIKPKTSSRKRKAKTESKTQTRGSHNDDEDGDGDDGDGGDNMKGAKKKPKVQSVSLEELEQSKRLKATCFNHQIFSHEKLDYQGDSHRLCHS